MTWESKLVFMACHAIQWPIRTVISIWIFNNFHYPRKLLATVIFYERLLFPIPSEAFQKFRKLLPTLMLYKRFLYDFRRVIPFYDFFLTITLLGRNHVQKIYNQAIRRLSFRLLSECFGNSSPSWTRLVWNICNLCFYKLSQEAAWLSCFLFCLRFLTYPWYQWWKGPSSNTINISLYR